MVINTEEKFVEIDGRKVRFAGRFAFSTLVYLAKRAQKDVTASRLVKSRQRLGSRHRGTDMNHLRQLIEQDPHNPRIIVTSGAGVASKYRLNAEVEFVGKSSVAKKSRESRSLVKIEMPNGEVVEIKRGRMAQLLEALRLSDSQTNSTRSDYLAQKVYGGSGAQERKILSVLVSLLRKDLKKFGWEIIQPVKPNEKAKGEMGRYYLSKIGQEEWGYHKKKEFVPYPVHPTRLAALNLMISDPKATADQIIRLLGRMKNDKPHGKNQAVGALLNAFRRLTNRSYSQSITASESTTYNDILAFLSVSEISNYKDFKAALAKLREHVLARISVKPGEVQDALVSGEVEETEKILSDEEALIITHLLNARRDIIRKYGIEEFPQENANKIIETLLTRVNGSVRVSRDRLEEVRRGSIEKLRKLARSGDDLIERQSSEVQDLICYFMLTDPEPIAQLLHELLTAPIEVSWLYRKGQPVTKVWRDMVLPDVPQAMPVERKMSIVEAAKTVVGDTMARVVEKSVPQEKISAIERRDPKAPERIRPILNQIERSLGLGKNVSGAQITRQWNNITSTEMNRMASKGHIKPKHTRRGGGKMEYEIVDVATLLYLRKFGNGLNGRLVRSLRHIILEEIQSRLAKNNR